MVIAHRASSLATILFLGVACLLGSAGRSPAQDRLKTMPGHAQYEKLAKEIGKAVKSGALQTTWKEEGKSLEFVRDGKTFSFDIASLKENEQTLPKEAPPKSSAGGKNKAGIPRGPGRGRQAAAALSPDGKVLATHASRNIHLSGPKGEGTYPITTAGSEKARIKCGVASWVYGEELEQKTALWWSPDSSKLAYYQFDESRVKDFYLALDQTRQQTRLDIEAYPKPGSENPVVDLVVHDLATGRKTWIDVRDGKPFDNTVVGHYVYNIAWSANGKELLFHRTNRLQKVMELVVADPATGKVRVVVREEWTPSWVENLPEHRFLKDGRRFIWASQRTGQRNYYLCDLDGAKPVPLTRHATEVANIVAVDEMGATLYYMARTGDNPMKLQLHRVGLDGSNDTRLTSQGFHHQVSLAPDFRHLVAISQTHDEPPTTRLLSVAGKELAVLAKSDITAFDKLGLKKVELFTFKAADKTTDLYGLLHRPSTFNPAQKYPLLVSVYAGPETNGARETFVPPSALAELGFLVVSLDSRSAKGRGKKTLDAIYQNLGMAEIDDQAEGVRELAKRSYVSAGKVGIYGTSYGGFAAAMCLARHPDLFHAAVACSAVTDFRNYDTIYTERYLGLPADAAKAYDKTSIMALAPAIKGRLMIFFGTADDNVHPNNALQLIQALQKAGKSFEVQVGPDIGHASVSLPRMMEFFIDHLVGIR